jgi:hypothetical protein
MLLQEKFSLCNFLVATRRTDSKLKYHISKNMKGQTQIDVIAPPCLTCLEQLFVSSSNLICMDEFLYRKRLLSKNKDQSIPYLNYIKSTVDQKSQ